MREFNPQKVFVQYRDIMKPYEPIIGRKYTITHSDETAELFVFIASNYAEDQITRIRDEVRVVWEKNRNGLVLMGYVTVDGKGIIGDASIRSDIFHREIPTAFKALRQSDRFLFDKKPYLDDTPLYIHFISSNPEYDIIYDFGLIGMYK